jgi:hypothetical protein
MTPLTTTFAIRSLRSFLYICLHTVYPHNVDRCIKAVVVNMLVTIFTKFKKICLISLGPARGVETGGNQLDYKIKEAVKQILLCLGPGQI